MERLRIYRADSPLLTIAARFKGMKQAVICVYKIRSVSQCTNRERTYLLEVEEAKM